MQVRILPASTHKGSMMKKVYIKKAEPITNNMPVDDVIIIIGGKGENFPDKSKSLHDVKIYYQLEAEKLYNALSSSLPQGIIEPLIIQFMQHHASLYKGTMERIESDDT
jgi:hypothetical protein